jgi:type IV pilus assembly protein PilN
LIRINLLAQPKAMTTSSAGQGWLVVLMLVVAAEIAGCFLYYGRMQDLLRAQFKTNQELQAEILASEQKVMDHKAIQDRLTLLREREDAISKLQDARTGPTAMMLEVANILTPGRGPSVEPTVLQTLRRDDPGRVFRPNWDTRRLWITSFQETNRRVTFEGRGRDGEDVSEFTRRITLSRFFSDVRLKSATREGAGFVKFILNATVKY